MLNEYLTIAQAAREIPSSSGRGVSTQTVWRWCHSGCKGVRLKCVRFGKVIGIHPDALTEFAQHLADVWESDRVAKKRSKTAPQAATRGAGKQSKGRTQAQRETAIAQAKASLKSAGILSEE